MSRLNPKDPIFTKQFSLRFRLLMSYHDVTLKDIALYTDNAISTVGTWKNGRLPGSYSTIEKLSTLFNVEPLYLLKGQVNGKDVPAPTTPLEAIRELSSQVKPAAGDVSFDVSTHWKAPEASGDSQETVSQNDRSVQRQYMEIYFRRYLDQIEPSSTALSKTWIDLQRLFPLQIQDAIRLQLSASAAPVA